VSTWQNKLKIQGDHFAKEAHKLLQTQSVNYCISLLQAVAVLSIYEYSFGDPHKGARLFFDVLRNLQPNVNPIDESLLPDDIGTQQKVHEVVSLIPSGTQCLYV
jgi:hypothetical protein